MFVLLIKLTIAYVAIQFAVTTLEIYDRSKGHKNGN